VRYVLVIDCLNMQLQHSLLVVRRRRERVKALNFFLLISCLVTVYGNGGLYSIVDPVFILHMLIIAAMFMLTCLFIYAPCIVLRAIID